VSLHLEFCQPHGQEEIPNDISTVEDWTMVQIELIDSQEWARIDGTYSFIDQPWI
jgi:hypothetical protein